MLRTVEDVRLLRDGWGQWRLMIVLGKMASPGPAGEYCGGNGINGEQVLMEPEPERYVETEEWG